MAGNAPYYDNVRWGGPSGLRVPQEQGKADLDVIKEVDINVGGAGTTNTITLTPDQTEASYYTLANAGSGATTVVWPACFNGRVFVVYNKSGQSSVWKVTGATGITVANTKRATLVMDGSLSTPDIARVTADT